MVALRTTSLTGSLLAIAITALLAMAQRKSGGVDVPALETLPVVTEDRPRIVYEVQRLDYPVVRRADGAWLYDSDPRCIGKVRTNLEALRACLERNGGGWD